MRQRALRLTFGWDVTAQFSDDRHSPTCRKQVAGRTGADPARIAAAVAVAAGDRVAGASAHRCATAPPAVEDVDRPHRTSALSAAQDATRHGAQGAGDGVGVDRLTVGRLVGQALRSALKDHRHRLHQPSGCRVTAQIARDSPGRADERRRVLAIQPGGPRDDLCGQRDQRADESLCLAFAFGHRRLTREVRHGLGVPVDAPNRVDETFGLILVFVFELVFQFAFRFKLCFGRSDSNSNSCSDSTSSSFDLEIAFAFELVLTFELRSRIRPRARTRLRIRPEWPGIDD